MTLSNLARSTDATHGRGTVTQSGEPIEEDSQLPLATSGDLRLAGR